MAYSSGYKQLGRRSLGLVILILLIEILALTKAVIILTTWPTGWPAMQVKLALELALFGVPAVATLVWSVPRLWRLARLDKRPQGEALPAEVRASATHIAVALPMQAVMLGAMAVLFYTYFTAVPLPVKLIVVPTLLAFVGTFVQGYRLHRRYLAMRSPAWTKPRLGVRVLRAAAGVLAAAAVLWIWLSTASQMSHLPAEMNMAAGVMDYGGSAAPANGEHAHHGVGGMSVATLTGPREGTPDQRFTLTAVKKTITLSSGQQVEAWTFNGQLPGPELRVKQGQLIEVTLVNADIEDGVTLHWHGLDVPNAEDGVAGVTQNAVLPGQTYVYRFIASDAGTYWYHSHQQSYIGAGKGLFGSLIVEPQALQKGQSLSQMVVDIPIVAHTYIALGVAPNKNMISFGASDSRQIKQIAPGTPVRLRLINTDNEPTRFKLLGTHFQVAAIDGTDLHEPSDLVDQDLVVASGGRYDVTFIMPRGNVFLGSISYKREGSHASLVMSPDGMDADFSVVAAKRNVTFDPLTYGSPDKKAIAAFNGHYDREFQLILDKRLGLYNGAFNYSFTINGKLFPDTPMLMVKEGDVVKTTIVNHSSANHPMHLHGHHMIVLSRNGQLSSGSPWWVDTLNVGPGETYEVAFIADNPGLWMDHCHNLQHATAGMTMHLMYEGITTPYSVGSSTQNHPE
ncbi:multicopper oxidase family protein [Paenibacillus qinlingensis]|uniref:FtsP/CotA-like multicopper oxidase with cupredoxin domain n=1 Tax=Paenibacillus qinlingensis TaxID=1837343 RepID=A0ABU1NYD0_9BACL|nr:multicopper oxidase family protein [Paenibacillus qinlingensis]MDR6552504.1 FtsP/CotA-like multicopper oxidase with cupredoxin domain [Paenibacillus qinlingensis]